MDYKKIVKDITELMFDYEITNESLETLRKIRQLLIDEGQWVGF